MTKSDISAAIDMLFTYNMDVFAARGDFTLIHNWINDGCDLIKDILPAIEEMTRRNPRITSVAYFGPAVYNKRDNRLAVEQAMKGKGTSLDPQSIETLLRYRAKGIYLTPAQKQKIAEYEKNIFFNKQTPTEINQQGLD